MLVLELFTRYISNSISIEKYVGYLKKTNVIELKEYSFNFKI